MGSGHLNCTPAICPAHDHVVAGIVARLLDLPRPPADPTPGTNRQVTVFGAVEVTTVSDARYRCALDQPLATAGLRAGLLECRLELAEK